MSVEEISSWHELLINQKSNLRWMVELGCLHVNRFFPGRHIL